MKGAGKTGTGGDTVRRTLVVWSSEVEEATMVMLYVARGVVEPITSVMVESTEVLGDGMTGLGENWLLIPDAPVNVRKTALLKPLTEVILTV